MKLRLILSFCMLAWSTAYAQVPSKLTGTYKLVAVDNIKPDGSRIHLYGDEPRGILILDPQGHYVLEIFSRGRPKFLSNDKSKGTAEENRLAIQGCNAHFGTYLVDTAKHTITFHIEHASFPNWENVTQQRHFEFDGKTLIYKVPTPTTGGNVTGEVIWEKE